MKSVLINTAKDKNNTDSYQETDMVVQVFQYLIPRVQCIP